jgi:hypothetical protein
MTLKVRKITIYCIFLYFTPWRIVNSLWKGCALTSGSGFTRVLDLSPGIPVANPKIFIYCLLSVIFAQRRHTAGLTQLNHLR